MQCEHFSSILTVVTVTESVTLFKPTHCCKCTGKDTDTFETYCNGEDRERRGKDTGHADRSGTETDAERREKEVHRRHSILCSVCIIVIVCKKNFLIKP